MKTKPAIQISGCGLLSGFGLRSSDFPNHKPITGSLR
jgi:hypothetical protein